MDKKTKLGMLGIFSASFYMYFYCIIQIFLANLYVTFNDVNESLVTMIMTLPQLASVIGSFIVAPLISKLDKKKMIFISMLAAFLSSMFALFWGAKSFGIMVLFSIITGFALSVINSVNNVAIAEMVPVEMVPKYAGIHTAVGSLGCVVMYSLAGVFAKSGDWSKAFLAALLYIPLLICVCLLYPSLKTGKKNTSSDTVNSKTGNNDVKMFVIIFICYIAFAIAAKTNSINLSSYIITEYQLGTSVETSLASNIGSVVAMVSGFLLVGPISRVFKSKFTSFALILSIISLVLPTLNTTSLTMIYLSQVFFGLGSSMVMPSLVSKAIAAMPKSTGIATSLITAAGGAGGFLSAFVLSGLNTIINGSFLSNYWIGAGISVICLLLSLFTIKSEQKE